MSKNTNIADLINYISVDGSGNVVLTTGGQVATQSYVTTAVSNLVNAAPSTLDTLNELATALGNDANFATTVTTSIATKLPLAGGTLTGALSGTSATFSGDLTIDTNTLYVDSTNNRVGIGTLGSAGYLLDVFGTATFGASTTVGNKVHIGSGAVPSGAAGIGMWATGSNLLSIVGLGDTTIDSRGSYLIINPNGGNVGIGQNNPFSPLSFANTTGNKIDFYNDGTARYSVQINGGELRFYTNQTNDIISLYAGNVLGLVNKNGSIGIGTISPQTPLQILKDTNTNGTNIEEANMAFSILSASGQSKIAIGACNAGNYGYIQVMQDATSWTNRNLTLQPRGGNVGVGTYTPNDKFEINSGQGARAGMALTGEYPYFRFNVTSSNANARNWVLTPTWAEFGDMVLAQSTIKDGNPLTQGANSIMYFSRAGSIGIGTITPSDKLQVVGSLRWGSETNNLVSFADGGGVYMELSAPNSSTRNLRIQGINNAGNKYSAIRLEAGIEEIAFVTADVERMRISSPGDLYLYNGAIQQQGVWTVFNSGFTDGTSSFNFDIGVGSEGGGGNIFKVEAGFAHFSGMAYNCLAEFYISTRGTGSEITDVIRRDTSLAGSFTAWKTTSTVLRINKSAGTYPGGGRYWIKVTKVNY